MDVKYASQEGASRSPTVNGTSPGTLTVFQYVEETLTDVLTVRNRKKHTDRRRAFSFIVRVYESVNFYLRCTRTNWPKAGSYCLLEALK